MMKFPQYKIEHFHYLHFYNGGLHIGQIQSMFQFAVEQKYEKYKFFAALSGIDLDKQNKNKSNVDKLDEQQKKQALPLFRDPKEYESMSQEELNELTNKMMYQHKNWAKKSNKAVGA